MNLRNEAEIMKCWTPNSKTIVTIVCTTYNQEKYIEDAIKGFLIQETNFPFEIIIHDDASADNSPKIIQQYEKQYLKIIRSIYQTENQFSKKISVWSDITFPLSRGKYIAICEGDDYWTDPFKLQKQVGFLETNPDYSLCVGGFTQLVEITQETSIIIKNLKENDYGKNGYTFSLNEMQKSWITKTLTSVFRKDLHDQTNFSDYKHLRDIHYFYHLIRNHKGFYFTENFGVYRIHEGGINSMKQGRVNFNAAYNCYKELYEKNKDEFTRIMNRRHTLGLLNYNLYNKYPGNTWRRNISLFFEAVKLTRRLTEVKYLFTAFIPSDLKTKLMDI